MRKLIIIGASGHGRVIADIANKLGYEKIVFLDDNESINQCDGYPVMGDKTKAFSADADIIIGIGNAEIRRRIQKSLPKERITTLIHPSAVVAENVRIGRGTVVMAGSVINPHTVIGEGCIVNTCASIDHDCIVGDYVHISVGSHVCGTVTVDAGTWIGAGATIINNVTICGDCMIGAGAVVVKDIKEKGTYVGVPARVQNKTNEDS